jgi:hypothetical protein
VLDVGAAQRPVGVEDAAVVSGHAVDVEGIVVGQARTPRRDSAAPRCAAARAEKKRQSNGLGGRAGGHTGSRERRGSERERLRLPVAR